MKGGTMNRIIRILLATLTGLGLMFGVVAIGAPAAVAAKPTPYVTKAEFNQVRKGMPMWKVHRIFDVNGKQIYYDPGNPARKVPPTQGRDYVRKQSADARNGAVSVSYKKVNGTWKVTGKYTFWWKDWANSAGAPATGGYVTKAEYKSVRKGMTLKQVHRTLGTAGTVFTYDDSSPGAYPAWQDRVYAVKSRDGSVTIEYQKVGGAWKVANKWVYWGN
jgi:hypothetical protein